MCWTVWLDFKKCYDLLFLISSQEVEFRLNLSGEEDRNGGSAKKMYVERAVTQAGPFRGTCSARCQM